MAESYIEGLSSVMINEEHVWPLHLLLTGCLPLCQDKNSLIRTIKKKKNGAGEDSKRCRVTKFPFQLEAVTNKFFFKFIVVHEIHASG